MHISPSICIQGKPQVGTQPLPIHSFKWKFWRVLNFWTCTDLFVKNHCSSFEPILFSLKNDNKTKNLCTYSEIQNFLGTRRLMLKMLKPRPVPIFFRRPGYIFQGRENILSNRKKFKSFPEWNSFINLWTVYTTWATSNVSRLTKPPIQIIYVFQAFEMVADEIWRNFNPF